MNRTDEQAFDGALEALARRAGAAGLHREREVLESLREARARDLGGLVRQMTEKCSHVLNDDAFNTNRGKIGR